VESVLKPHASSQVSAPEARARKPPITSQATHTSIEKMRARPDATDGMVRRPDATLTVIDGWS